MSPTLRSNTRIAPPIDYTTQLRKRKIKTIYKVYAPNPVRRKRKQARVNYREEDGDYDVLEYRRERETCECLEICRAFHLLENKKKYGLQGNETQASTCPDEVEIRETRNPNLGKGLFAKVPIFRGTVIGYYKGTLRKKDNSRVTARAVKRGDCMDVETRRNHGPEMLDGSTPRGNMLRFVNTSAQCKINIRTVNHREKTDEGFLKMHPAVAFLAKRDITPGEQLFVPYGADYTNKLKLKYPSLVRKGYL